MLPKRCLSFSDNCSSTRPTTILSLIISSVKVPKLQCSASVCNAVMNVWTVAWPRVNTAKRNQPGAAKRSHQKTKNPNTEWLQGIHWNKEWSSCGKSRLLKFTTDNSSHEKKLAPILKLEAKLVKYLCQLCHARSPCYETLLWAIDQTVHTVFDWIEHTAFYHLRNLAQ